MPLNLDDYNIGAPEDAKAYVMNAIDEMYNCTTPDDKYTYALIAFTVCNEYFHWLVDEHGLLASIRREVGAFRKATTAREMQLCAEFEPLVHRINAILPMLSGEKFAALPPASLRPRPAGPAGSAGSGSMIVNSRVPNPQPDTPRPPAAGLSAVANVGARRVPTVLSRPNTAGFRRVPAVLGQTSARAAAAADQPHILIRKPGQ